MTELDAVYAFAVAFAVAALVTPLGARLARRVGAIDAPRERGLSSGGTPLLGGLGIFAGAARRRAAVPARHRGCGRGSSSAAALITFVGALDDRFDLSPAVKLAGQVVAAVILGRRRRGHATTSRCRSSAR